MPLHLLSPAASRLADEAYGEALCFLSGRAFAGDSAKAAVPKDPDHVQKPRPGARGAAQASSSGAGILAMEMYLPAWRVSQADLERFDSRQGEKGSQ